MPDLLLELFSEEIPARMQARAAVDLERALNKGLIEAGFMPEGVKAFATPRRLAAVASGLPARQPDRREEKKGPRAGAPEKAIEGFLKSAGLSSLAACEQREDKKGAYYVAVIDRKGRETADIIAEMVPAIVRGFSWPRSMRWGDKDLRWVRPLHSVLCAFNGEIVPFEIDGVASGDRTYGHRFMAPEEIQTRSFDDYAEKLCAAKVVLDAEERKDIIAGDAATLCRAQGLEIVDDPGLLNEVAGLAEWPVAMIGAFDEKFLKLPDEVLTATMRGHQKYFSMRNPRTGRLANRFVFVANLEARDGGAGMREGYERVLAARLSDAWFLYNQDLKTPLEERLKDLDRVTFFEGLGTFGQKAQRLKALVSDLRRYVEFDEITAHRAAQLAKADLASQMVYEFPELQGVMGRYYYLVQHSSSPACGGGGREAAGGGDASRAPSVAPDKSGATASPQAGEQEAQAIADAIRDHYKPVGQDDETPTAPVSVAVALADKIDTLYGFFAIEQVPTGSRDPFALRRSSLGIIRIILEGDLRIKLSELAEGGLQLFRNQQGQSFGPGRVVEILPFFHDRLKVYLRDKGHRYDAIDAVLRDAEGELQDDLVLIVRKLDALEAFLKTDDGENLAIAFKRAANILKAEEKKGALPRRIDETPCGEEAMNGEDAAVTGMALRAGELPPVDPNLFVEKPELKLYQALEKAEAKAAKAVEKEDFEAAMGALAALRAPVDTFFDKVTVNAEDETLRANRLALLARLVAATATVADFSKLEG